jgi:arginyl-tRNA synthetase
MSSQNYSPPFSLAGDLEAALANAALATGLDAGKFRPEIRIAEPVHGDYQANGVLAYAKEARINPRALAEQIVARLPAELQARFRVSVTGPGFINFSVQPSMLGDWLRLHASREALSAGAGVRHRGQVWVVDYSAPNTAKQMHVGHLRSAVIGEAISRMMAFAGAEVVRDNHVGDWGTQFGKLIWAYKRHLDAAAVERDPIEEFERLYKLGNHAAEADPAVLKEAQQELVRLQGGDPENHAIWSKINETSLAAFQKIYDRLGIRFDATLGESFYNDKVERVYRELADCGLAAESEGALVVFHRSHPSFATQPFIIRKSDGAANYASSDLATLLYRAEHFAAFGVIYVVDSRQRDHFEQLFLTAEAWFGCQGRRLPRMIHVDFGTVLGENGRPLKTRSGDNIRLSDLFGEAVDRAYALVTGKNPQLTEADRREIAEVVGIASVQYADLAQNRTSDYLFSWEKMISFDGNTAAYLLYASARIHSIFRRLGTSAAGDEGVGAAGPPETPAEIGLARKLVKFADALRQATETLRPHFICLYLYELAGEFSSFYDSEKVLVDDPAVRARRLLLCRRTLLMLETGLHLLGLRTLERM